MDFWLFAGCPGDDERDYDGWRFYEEKTGPEIAMNLCHPPEML
jgi:hypothetical protein